MFNSVHEALLWAYRVSASLIMSQGNAASIFNNGQSSGARGSGQGLTQHDHHAMAAILIRRTEEILSDSPLLLAAVRCEYAGEGRYCHEPMMVLDQHYREKTGAGVRGGFQFIIHNLYTATPNWRDILTSGVAEDICKSRRTFFRVKNEIKNDIADWVNEAKHILEDDFMENRIVVRKVA
ncbi:MAG: hypothetical protein KBC57_03280 [Neisseriaceae bacterium]|nr:hypothetical protein [Neisseriaceae bacterium]